MVLGSTVLGVFEQLGILEEFYKFSLPTKQIVFRDEKLNKLATISMENEEAVYVSTLIALQRMKYTTTDF